MHLFSCHRLAVFVSLLLFISFNLIGCATYQGKVAQARSALIERNYQKALNNLRPLALENNGDQLVYLLDFATTLQISGNYQESIKYFLMADRLSEQLDYQSISRQTGSMLLSEEMNQYKGDTFEKIFINAYLAMNYLEIGKFDDALIEARRINEKYLKHRHDEKKAFELNSFSKYLSAMIWEATRNYDDAYIGYNEAFEIDPNIRPIKRDLIRTAKLARRMDTYKSLKAKFPEVKEEPSWYDKTKGELIIIYQQGWGPRKYEPHYNDLHIPELAAVHSKTKMASLSIEGLENSKLNSTLIYDVKSAAIQTLKEDMAPLIAKRIAARVAKVAASREIGKNNKLLGDLSIIAMTLSDRADLRQWSMLPESIQIIRTVLPEGTYKFNLNGLDESLLPTGESLLNQEVHIKNGEKKFIIWRSLK
jgi:hypothetical protein